MKKNVEDLVTVVKEQVQMFLLHAGEFYPFATYIGLDNQIKPVSAFVEDDFPSSKVLISVLEEQLRKGVFKGNYNVAVLVVDVTVNEDDSTHDAIELRFFEQKNIETKQYIKYITHDTYIEFI